MGVVVIVVVVVVVVVEVVAFWRCCCRALYRGFSGMLRYLSMPLGNFGRRLGSLGVSGETFGIYGLALGGPCGRP